MKKLLFPLFFFWINIMVAQNYQNICTPGITFYRSPDNYFMAFRSDSVLPVGVGDTLFFSYRAIRTLSDTGCLDTTSGSILGRKIYKTQTGWFYLFNRNDDTVKINSQATLNQSWRFCTLPANGYLEARVTSVISDSVLGAPDAVKIITFQAKDAGNNNIAHPLNQKSIRLSQHWGLSRMLDVFSVPDDTTFYTIAGKSVPAVGIQNLTWPEIYDYQVGDEFHFTGLAMYTASWKTIMKVLSRTDYGLDSVKYTLEHCQQLVSATYPNYSTVHDTVTQTFSFIENPQNTWLSRLPGEFIREDFSADDYWFSTQYVPERRQKGISWGGFLFARAWNSGDTCWRTGNGYYWTISAGDYTKGLGKTRTYWDQAEPPYYAHMEENLVYYKKGTISWGTPITTDCFALLSIESKEAEVQTGIKVVPNPAEAEVQVTLNDFNPDDSWNFTLYTYSGIKVFSGKASSNQFILSRDGLASGLYILTISDRDGAIKGRTRIIYK
ncbi:MAG: T9SS type A sorting domain-containing protein [Bacteroidota bacterium]